MSPDFDPHDSPLPNSAAVAATGREEFDPTRPHPARIYDYWLGGKDGFAADREVAQQVAQLAPWVISGARGNRAFLGRAVRYLAQAGIRQFVDIGSGLPSPGNVHEVAHAVDPGCRVVYVDNDPIVLVHARALQASASTIAVAGDARDPAAILTDPQVRSHLDLDRPTAVLLVAILHFLRATDDPAAVVATVRDALAPGSFVVISHVADLSDGPADPQRAQATREAGKLYEDLAAPLVLRSRQEISGLFAGFDLVDPGLVAANEWRPRRGRPGPAVPVLAGVGRLRAPNTSTGIDPATTGSGDGDDVR